MIRFENVSYQYQDTKEAKQLEEIELTIPQGRFLLVAGKSGCGKSTLAQCINGLIPYFHEGEMTGSVWLGKYETTELSIEEIGEKAGSVFQDPRSQFFTTNTTDEIAFGCQNMSLPREEILKRVEETIRTFRIEDLRDRSLFELSSGQKQKVAIASCYCMKPDIYIMDEPSANLDPVAIAELAEVLAALKAQGNTIILIEHRLYYAKDLMDEMIYMENGRITERMSREEALALSGEELRERGLRVFDLEQIRKRKENRTARNTDLLEVRNIAFAYKKKRKLDRFAFGSNKEETKEETLLADVNFTAHGGEVIGIVGQNGVGKTTLARVLTGLLREKKGDIYLNGRRLDEKERMKNSYFVLQDSDYQLFSESVEREICLGHEREEDIAERGGKILEALGLGDYRNTHPAALSRGQKQRLTIAGALVSKAPVQVLDEPTSGLDGASMQEVIGLLKEMRNRGKIVFVISHDYEFLVNGCDRILQVGEGRIKEDY
ncbi:MAG: ABC transporter ATP-binding protein, partial [Lachnospiraceae bacterium]